MAVLERLFGRRASALADGLDAGRQSRRLSNFLPSRAHVNTLIQSSGQTALARARYLARNNGYALNAVECFSSNVVGAGIVPRWLPPEQNEELKQQGKELWEAWTDEADAEGLTDFYGLQRRAAREIFMAGECFVRRRPRRLSDGLTVPLQLQLLPSEMLDTNFTQDMPGGNRIRQGIEFNRIGQRVAYHFWMTHPNDSTEQGGLSQRVRVPSTEVLHILDPLEGGQIRGLTRLTAAIVPLYVLDAYDDAELERKKTAALFSVFIKRQDPTPTFIDKVAEDAAKADDGIATVDLKPGAAHQLLAGEEVQIASPGDVGPNFEAFQYRTLARICAALGLPYAGVTGDLVRANYANQRAALIESRRRLEAIQHGVIVFLMCRPVWQWFLDAAVLADALALPRYVEEPKSYRKVRWIPPRWEWVDPLKDRQAERLAIDSRTKAVSQVIEQEGFDPDEVFKLIAQEQEKMRVLGVPPPATQTGQPAANQSDDQDDEPPPGGDVDPDEPSDEAPADRRRRSRAS